MGFPKTVCKQGRINWGRDSLLGRTPFIGGNLWSRTPSNLAELPWNWAAFYDASHHPLIPLQGLDLQHTWPHTALQATSGCFFIFSHRYFLHEISCVILMSALTQSCPLKLHCEIFPWFCNLVAKFSINLLHSFTWS